MRTKEELRNMLLNHPNDFWRHISQHGLDGNAQAALDEACKEVAAYEMKPDMKDGAIEPIKFPGDPLDMIMMQSTHLTPFTIEGVAKVKIGITDWQHVVIYRVRGGEQQAKFISEDLYYSLRSVYDELCVEHLSQTLEQYG